VGNHGPMANDDLPEIYKAILPWGDRTSRAGEQPTVRIGGKMGNPVLSLSYLLAARRTIGNVRSGGGEPLGVVAFPIVFLQRHAYELALKEMIQDAYGFVRGKAWLAPLKSEGQGAKISAVDTPAHGHDLNKVYKELEAATIKSGYAVERLSGEIRVMAERLTEIEQRKNTRARYGEFDKPVELELGKVQLDLESLYEREFWARDWDDVLQRDTLHAEMALDAHDMSQEIYSLEVSLGFGGKPITDFTDWW
jgi:hypothetical protein